MTKEDRAKYIREYKKRNLVRVPLDLSHDKFAELQEVAKKAGESVNGYIKEAIRQRIEREGQA